MQVKIFANYYIQIYNYLIIKCYLCVDINQFDIEIYTH